MMIFVLVLSCALCLTSALPAAPPRCQGKYQRLVVFGDSFSDDGHGSWIVSNETWPADKAYAGHHFSNGPVWAQDLASTLGIRLLDFATGGATVDNSFVAGFTGPYSGIPVPSATDQIHEFLNQSTPKPDDIFVHWIGANDWFFNTSISGAQVTSLVTRNIDTLYRAGARTIILADIPSPASFPATYNVDSYNPAVAKDYANQLTEGLQNVVSAYSAYSTTGLVSIGTFFADIISAPRRYGIDPKYIDPPTACLNGAYPSEGVERSLCNDPAQHLFFDSYHPTKQVHARISKLFMDTIGCS